MAGDTVALQMFPQKGTCPLKRNCGAGSPPAHAFVLSTGRGPFIVWEPEAEQGTSSVGSGTLTNQATVIKHYEESPAG